MRRVRRHLAETLRTERVVRDRTGRSTLFARSCPAEDEAGPIRWSTKARCVARL
jgi:hypothetical protein